MPCVTAIVADLYPEKRRGVAFGWVLCAAAAGAPGLAGTARRRSRGPEHCSQRQRLRRH
jgi:hypothetical protein